ncbi:hypothetical protein EVAR_38246_1 [Eumeta japonica]|uniref:Uncharacterized protein n=1 Tax=Eumeta variegata TaxID=151549 RepID=A0A4C1Y9A1_EUMVA|nr:hypothetical protein EVAR_38246_1 [Eumeta japonica]
MLTRLEEEGSNLVSDMVTGDETWVFATTPKQAAIDRMGLSKAFSRCQDASKVSAKCWHIDRFIVPVDHIPESGLRLVAGPLGGLLVVAVEAEHKLIAGLVRA